MRNAGLEEAQAGIKIPGRNINNLRYANDTTLMAESEELKGLWLKVKEESEKVGFSSVPFSCSVVSDCLRPYESQHARPPMSITNSRSSPRLTSIESVMPSSHLILCRSLISCPQSLPASESFQMSQLFASGGQSIGVSASASVLPMNIQD